MVFITLGSQKFQFNRLLIKVDELIKKGVMVDNVFAQIGVSDYLPKNYNYKRFLDNKEYVDMMNQGNIIITHGGTATIINSIKKEKKIIVVPRLAKYGEHVDDHQIELVKQFEELNLICSCYDCSMLEKSIEIVKENKFSTYKSNTENMIKSIEEFIDVKH